MLLIKHVSHSSSFLSFVAREGVPFSTFLAAQRWVLSKPLNPPLITDTGNKLDDMRATLLVELACSA